GGRRRRGGRGCGRCVPSRSGGRRRGARRSGARSRGARGRRGGGPRGGGPRGGGGRGGTGRCGGGGPGSGGRDVGVDRQVAPDGGRDLVGGLAGLRGVAGLGRGPEAVEGALEDDVGVLLVAPDGVLDGLPDAFDAGGELGRLHLVLVRPGRRADGDALDLLQRFGHVVGRGVPAPGRAASGGGNDDQRQDH